MIGRLHHVIIDCPDPPALAGFYSELIGLPVTWRQDDFAVVARNSTSSGIAFQLAPGHRPPRWPDPRWPQQFHLDVMVDDVAAAEPRVLALGARRLPGGGSSRVYADPAGHPFCLVPRPSWAPPIAAGSDVGQAEGGRAGAGAGRASGAEAGAGASGPEPGASGASAGAGAGGASGAEAGAGASGLEPGASGASAGAGAGGASGAGAEAGAGASGAGAGASGAGAGGG